MVLRKWPLANYGGCVDSSVCNEKKIIVLFIIITIELEQYRKTKKILN